MKDKTFDFEILSSHDEGEGAEQSAEITEIDDGEALKVADSILDKYLDAFLELAK